MKDLKNVFCEAPNLHPLPLFKSDENLYTTNNLGYLINSLIKIKNR